jgi:hypothetical protein
MENHDIQNANCPFCVAETLSWEGVGIVCLECCDRALDKDGSPHKVKYKWDKRIESLNCLPWRVYIDGKECYQHYFLGICITLLVDDAPDFFRVLCED